MTLRVSGKNLDIGLAFRTHIETRIDSVLSKYRAAMVAGHVTVEPEGSGFRADCTLHLRSGATLQADAKAQEPYASFNRAADLVENQIRRHRERLADRHGSATADGKTLLNDALTGIRPWRPWSLPQRRPKTRLIFSRLSSRSHLRGSGK